MSTKKAEDILKEIQNIEVDEFSTPCTVTAAKGASVDQLLGLMKENGVRHIPVIENETPIGIVSDRDIQNVPPGAPLVASDAMSTDLYIVQAGTLLKDVVFEMSTKKLGSVLVKGSSAELSIFTSVDALNALNEILRGEIL